ncbi:hypothetical protein FWP33_20460 [Vibrio parahaemolyticus]|uniref:Uncharacterized protein n=2 Tax=Vibrio harveyi group TaxID=717610 RepID=A0A9Q3UAP7_VIBPH|nr:hypothetical protein [Vibrio parahaemolyticus]ELA8176725.1 hypothetical protein [Vibrio alginolyticus]CAH1598860.1 conserved membrane hypothetical protein [Vibrio jasicida]EGQ9744874.1 hypothetical protein [Vibrio parahaemolyticus]EJC7176164.1 hypothetical protein [Vibrio parahaemolyticus]EJE4724603.1 hypothetical protein [Vibrio parahaemolyticus]
MTALLKADFEVSGQQLKTGLIMLLVAAAFFLANYALAQTGNSTVLDDSLDSAWNELQALATGNGGRILMIIMILGGIYFSVIAPNGMYFLGCVGGLLVLSNITDLIDAALVASFDAVPALDMLMQVAGK